MNTCGSCKHWYECECPEENHGHYCYQEFNDEEDVKTTPDMSCPRFEAKEPEIPATLKDWKPVWHPVSEKPGGIKSVLVKAGGLAVIAFWTGCEWRNDPVVNVAGKLSFAPHYWTELP